MHGAIGGHLEHVQRVQHLSGAPVRRERTSTSAFLRSITDRARFGLDPVLVDAVAQVFHVLRAAPPAPPSHHPPSNASDTHAICTADSPTISGKHEHREPPIASPSRYTTVSMNDFTRNV